MTKSKAILIFIVLLVVAISIGMLTASGRLQWADEPKNAFKNKGLLKVICEVEISRPTNGLGEPFETETMTIPAEFDFEEKTGWYPGEFTISENRKGTLTINDSILEISRPAMFKKYGFVVLGDHATLDRTNGAFKQWLDLEGQKRLDLITGHCITNIN